MSGNSLSKELAILGAHVNNPVVCFVDEFDKLFISGNSNSCPNNIESMNGVQNEFLKVLESEEASVFGDYGKYVRISVKNVLFIFAGAFNGEKDLSLDRLREIGLKTEFLGRVSLLFQTEKLSANDLCNILDQSKLFEHYLELFEDVDHEKASYDIKAKIIENYENNTLGARMVNTLVHQYFINGGFDEQMVNKTTFQKKLKFND